MKLNQTKINLIKNKDIKTIEEIYNKYYKLVQFIIYKNIKSHQDIEDLSQEVFVKVFNKIDTYKLEYKFTSWISTITRNVVIDFLRKHKETVEFDESVYLNDEVSKEVTYDLDKKIKSILNDEEYIIVTHKLYFDFKFKDIAIYLDSNIASITGKYYRAISKLKCELKKEDFYDYRKTN